MTEHDDAVQAAETIVDGLIIELTRRERARRTVLDAIGRIIADQLNLLFAAWLVMLLVGALHSLEPQVPTFGYVVVLLALLILRISVAVTRVLPKKPKSNA